MNQRRCLIWLMTVLGAVLLTVSTNWQTQDVAPAQDCPQCSEQSVMTPQRQQSHEATLTDATQLYRICSSRPQRILPTHGARSPRTLTSAFNSVRQHIFKPLHSFYDSRCRLESAPFCLSASCDYYVIALRHIIR